MSLFFACWYAIPCGLCVPRAPFGCPSAPRRVPVVFVCTRALAVLASPPHLAGVARAPRAVPAHGAGRAVPCGSCPSAFAARVPCSAYLGRQGGVARLPRPPACSPWGRASVPRAVWRLGGAWGAGGGSLGGGGGGGLPALPSLRDAVGPRSGMGGSEAARPSLCLLCGGIKAGVAQVMVVAVSILLWFVSVCFHRAPPEGGATGRPGGPAGDRRARRARLGLRYLSRGPVSGLHAFVLRLAGVTGAAGGRRPGGAWRVDTAVCLAWLSGGGGGGLPTWRRGSRGPILGGCPRRVAASRRSVAARGEGEPCQGSALPPPLTGPPLRFSAVSLAWQRRMPRVGLPGAVLEGHTATSH